MKQKKEILNYLSQVPATWDKTEVIDASVGDYIIMRRKKGDTWYVAAMDDENPRSLSLDLSFLEQETYDVAIFSDVEMPIGLEVTIPTVPKRLIRRII